MHKQDTQHKFFQHKGARTEMLSQKQLACHRGVLRDGGLSISEEICGKRPFSSVFWIFQVLFGPSGKG